MERLSDIINSSSQQGSSSTATETSESETDTDDTSEFQRQSGYIVTLSSLHFYIFIVKFTSGYRATSTQPPTGSSGQSKMVTAGVQTGTTDDEDYRRPPNPRESQLSFSLSDLSDEEVDRRITRLTQEVKRISSNSKRISNGSQVFHLNL